MVWKEETLDNASFSLDRRKRNFAWYGENMLTSFSNALILTLGKNA